MPAIMLHYLILHLSCLESLLLVLKQRYAVNRLWKGSHDRTVGSHYYWLEAHKSSDPQSQSYRKMNFANNLNEPGRSRSSLIRIPNENTVLFDIVKP